MQSRITKVREEIISKSDFAERLQEQQFLQKIVSSRMIFSEELLISKDSKYGDSVWIWDDSSNPRLKIYGPSDLMIDWGHFTKIYNLTSEIVDDLKKYAFFRINYSTAVFSATKKNAHPFPVVREVRIISKYLAYVRSIVSVAGKSLVTKLSDIKVQDLRDAFDGGSQTKDFRLKFILVCLASETLNKHFESGRVKWNKEDIASLPWKKQKNTPCPQLPEKLFSFLSNNAASDVKQFLAALQIDVEDKTMLGSGSNIFLQTFGEFRSIFEKYVKYKNDLTEENIKSSKEFNVWVGSKKIKFRSLVDRACYAARIIIMLYTGARYSEVAGFKLDCLHKRDEFWFIYGTVIKHKDLNAPTDQDKWVAIPIVRDAISVLQQTARLSNSSLLFHSCVFSSSNPNEYITSDTISNGIKKYISIVDIKNDWKGIRPTSQQFRNSLVFEMRKASLGLPFITYQLKHAYNALERNVSDTTLGYGSLASDAVQKAIADANYIALREIYHPDAPIAGGGAEQHKNRREAYFRGMAHQGMDIDKILRFLASEGGMPLTDVGLGYCQGQGAKILVDGIKTDPPCVGSLRCNPVNCQNAVIPEHKLPAWKKSLVENQARADDPEFAYARNHLLEAVTEAKSVVQFFQIQGRKKSV